MIVMKFILPQKALSYWICFLCETLRFPWRPLRLLLFNNIWCL